MRDSLENFVHKNRAEFEETPSSDRVWKRIDSSLHSREIIVSLLWKAAAILFLASTVYLLADRGANHMRQSEPALTLTAEMQEAEAYYLSLIDVKKQEVKQALPVEQQEVFLSEIHDLDLYYQELKEAYQLNSSNERVLHALIRNLQLRLNILNKQLEILSTFKKEKNEVNDDLHI